MEFFLDTADVDAIKELNKTGLIDGVTTNPSLVAKSGKDFFTILKDISNIYRGSRLQKNSKSIFRAKSSKSI